MAKKLEIYKCAKGITLEVLTEGESCEIQCCGEPVQLMEEKTADTGKEKHVPVIRDGRAGIKVLVGEVPHPMLQEHYIQWIEVINGDYVNRKYLKPGDAPEAEFYVPNTGRLTVREYCNVHGLWKG